MNYEAIVQNLVTSEEGDVKFKPVVQFLYSSILQFGLYVIIWK